MIRLISFVKTNWIALGITLLPAGQMLGIMPYSSFMYYVFLVGCVLYLLTHSHGVRLAPSLFLVACGLSILLGSPDPLFRSWERLGLFALVLMVCYPIIISERFDAVRLKAYKMVLCLLTFTSVGSFFCYFMGINYMTKAFSTFADSVTVDTVGWFGGLTYQSMLLGPISAIAATFLLWILIEAPLVKIWRILILFGLLASICCMFISASRSANVAGLIGCLSLILIKYRSRFDKFVKVAFGIGILAMVLSPIYMPFAEKVLSKQESNVAAGSAFASRSQRWEHRWEEFERNPIFGHGFVAIDTKNTGEYMRSTGIVEAGTSWLSILSMTGLLGFSIFVYMLLSVISRLYRKIQEDDAGSLLLLPILLIFCVHFIAEGYIFAGGGYMCYLFWLTFGTASYYSGMDCVYDVVQLSNIDIIDIDNSDE